MAFNDIRNLTRALVVTGAAAVLAALGWMSAADRTAVGASRPKIYFGGSAAAQLAFGDLARNDPRSALRQAEWAVRSAPVEPSATSALGSASLALGRPEQAYAAFVTAGSLGWRDIPTQLYWLAQAVAGDDVEVVAERLDALLRLNIDDASVANSLDLLERTPPGRVALATLLSKNPPWESRFLANTGKLSGDDFTGRVAAIDLAAAKGAALDCGAIGTAASRLIVDGRVSEARDLSRRACDRSGDLYLSNGSFEADPAKLSAIPFNWRLQTRAGLDVDIAPAPAPLTGHALRIASSMTVRTFAARQLTALRPGRYRLTWQTALDGGKPDDSVTVLIQCNGTTPLDTPEAAPLGQAGGITKSFVVPAQGCPIQAVAIQKAASVSGDSETGWIDNIEIRPTT